MTPGERLGQSLRKQTKNEVARRGLDGKKIPKKSLQGLLPGRETPDFFFLTAHEHDESWRCVHVDVREVGEVRDNCGFAYAGQGQIMNLSQISGHVRRCSWQRWNQGCFHVVTNCNPVAPSSNTSHDFCSTTISRTKQQQPLDWRCKLSTGLMASQDRPKQQLS